MHTILKSLSGVYPKSHHLRYLLGFHETSIALKTQKSYITLMGKCIKKWELGACSETFFFFLISPFPCLLI